MVILIRLFGRELFELELLVADDERDKVSKVIPFGFQAAED